MRTKSEKNSGLWRMVVIVLSVLLLAGLLRLMNLNSLPVFADESIYIRWSQVMKAEATLRFLPLSDGKQPLYMWLVIPALKFISDPLVAGRVVSGLAGLGTSIGISIAAYLLFKNPKSAVSAGLIWSVLPYAVFFDRMALADSLLTMFVVWGFVFMYLSMEKLRWDFSMLAGFALGFAWLTKSPAMFSFVLAPFLFIFVPWKSLPGIKKLIPFGLLATTFAIAFGMYNILRLGPEYHMISLRNSDYLYPLSEVMKHPRDPLLPHLKDSLNFFFYYFTPIGLLLVVLGLFEGKFHHSRERLLLAVWFLGPVFAESFIAKVFTARYILFTVPFAVILMSHGIWHFGDRTKKHFLSFVVLALLVIVSLGFDSLLIFNPQSAPLPANERAGYMENWTAGTGIRDVSIKVKNYAQNGPVIVGSEGFFGTPFSALQMYLNDTPNVRVVGVGQNISAVSQDLTNALDENQVFLVANTSRMLKNHTELGLELIDSYPKAQHEDGSREYLQFMKLPTPPGAE